MTIHPGNRTATPGKALRGLAVLGCAAAMALTASAGAAAALEVRASGFTHSGGQAIAKILLPGDSIAGNGHWLAAARIVNGRAEFQFRDLPKGDYAAIVFHDENGNGTIDHGLFGPSEPLGFSGGFALSITAGLPTFAKLRFSYSGGAQVLAIEVR